MLMEIRIDWNYSETKLNMAIGEHLSTTPSLYDLIDIQDGNFHTMIIIKSHLKSDKIQSLYSIQFYDQS